MCKNRYLDCIAAILSVLIGIAIAILTYASIIPGISVFPWIALGFSALTLLLLTIGATSLLRQDNNVDNCVCRRGGVVLIASILTLIFAVIALLGTLTNLIAAVVFVGLIAVSFLYGIYALYTFLYCMITAGCKREESCDCKCR